MACETAFPEVIFCIISHFYRSRIPIVDLVSRYFLLLIYAGAERGGGEQLEASSVFFFTVTRDAPSVLPFLAGLYEVDLTYRVNILALGLIGPLELIT